MNEKTWYLCNSSAHENHEETGCGCGLENAHKWASKQTDLSQATCTKRGGAKGCGSGDFVELLEKGFTHTSGNGDGDFRSVRDKILDDDTIEGDPKQQPPLESKETKIGRVLLSGVTIRLFHKSMFLIVEKYLKVKLGITSEIEDDLEEKAMAVVELLTVKATPVNAYLFTWALIIIPPVIGKFLFPTEEVEEMITEKNDQEEK